MVLACVESASINTNEINQCWICLFNRASTALITLEVIQDVS